MPEPGEAPELKRAREAAKKKKEMPEACRGESARGCRVSKPDFKKAAKLYNHAVAIRKTKPEEALQDFEDAYELEPLNVIYASAKEMMRQQLVYDHTHKGDHLASEKRTVEALAEFRLALELDPGNAYVRQRMRHVAHAPLPVAPSFVEPDINHDAVYLHPRAGRQPLDINSDMRSAYEQVGKAFGIKITFDEPVRPKPVNLFFTNVTFGEAMNAIAMVTGTFWTAISPNEVLIANDTVTKHKEIDHWLLRTFYLPEAGSSQELADVVSMLRTIFELRLITAAPASQTITMRGPAPLIEAVTLFLQTLWAGKPQVMLDVDIYEISHQLLDNYGVQVPLQFTMNNIPAAALAALGGSNLQNLLNQIQSGGINSVNSSTLNAALAQLQQQSSLFSQPVATFGGGTTLMGIPIPPGTINMSSSRSWVMHLQQASLRAEQGDAATLRVGARYPVLSASYSSLNSSATSTLPPQLANLLNGVTSGTTAATNPLATFPSFTFEDLGLTLKAKPFVHEGSDVTLEMEMQMTSLGNTVYNSVPVLNNRSYKGVITLRDGEPAIIASALSRTEQVSLSGLPGFSHIPLISDTATNKNKEHDQDELLVVITPHIVNAGPPHRLRPILIPPNEP